VLAASHPRSLGTFRPVATENAATEPVWPAGNEEVDGGDDRRWPGGSRCASGRPRSTAGLTSPSRSSQRPPSLPTPTRPRRARRVCRRSRPTTTPPRPVPARPQPGPPPQGRVERARDRPSRSTSSPDRRPPGQQSPPAPDALDGGRTTRRTSVGPKGGKEVSSLPASTESMTVTHRPAATVPVETPLRTARRCVACWASPRP
jgi:hypothetical protein